MMHTATHAATHAWDPERYLQYADERGRPFVELLARVGATAPATVVDLGCGPGNLTHLLRERWPDASVVGLDSSILMHPMVWKSSGHVANFADPMVDCRSCKKRFRCDEISATYEDDGKLPEKVGNPHCPEAKKEGTVGKSCDLTPARKFNLMFETHLGPVADSAAKTCSCSSMAFARAGTQVTTAASSSIQHCSSASKSFAVPPLRFTVRAPWAASWASAPPTPPTCWKTARPRACAAYSAIRT